MITQIENRTRFLVEFIGRDYLYSSGLVSWLVVPRVLCATLSKIILLLLYDNLFKFITRLLEIKQLALMFDFDISDTLSVRIYWIRDFQIIRATRQFLLSFIFVAIVLSLLVEDQDTCKRDIAPDRSFESPLFCWLRELCQMRSPYPTGNILGVAKPTSSEVKSLPRSSYADNTRMRVIRLGAKTGPMKQRMPSF